MRFAACKPVAAALAFALLTTASASAAVPGLERLGQPMPAAAAAPGVQLAETCGNWQPSAANASEACRGRQAIAPDAQWIRQGDPGSQDRIDYDGFSGAQSKKEQPVG